MAVIGQFEWKNNKYGGNFYFSLILIHSLCREWNDEGMMINSSIRRYTFEYRSKVSLIYGGEGGSLFGPFVTQMTIFGTVYFNVAVVFRARVECGREIDPRDIPFFIIKSVSSWGHETRASDISRDRRIRWGRPATRFQIGRSAREKIKWNAFKMLK